MVVDNRVEVADLDAAPGPTNPVALSLRSLGGEVPTDVAISAPLDVGGGGLRVVALLARGQLSLFDLDAPAVPPITIPTGQIPGTPGPRPIEAVFVGERIVVRTEAGEPVAGVLVLALVKMAYDVAEVLRDLYRLKTDKQLSFGERRMLETAKTLMVKEVALARRWTDVKAGEELDRACA